MLKGGAAIGDRILFDKYRLLGRLGNGRSGTVYLAYHTELETYRAVKIVPKTRADYDTFRREALFLKTLRHPGIPIVYDVEEDAENSYLIEEYLEGESLYAMVKRLGPLSMETAVSLGIQLCRIIQFMNSEENPILYLDLQPKNLIVCGGNLHLTDFDHAQYETNMDEEKNRYGTPGFAAPEQYTGDALDCRTDVYAIGALLYYMSRGEPPGSADACAVTGGPNREMDRIIRGCMAYEKEKRYQTAGQVEEALLETGIAGTSAVKSQTIVFMGAKAGIGTTHAALGMSDFLTRTGYSVLYQEGYDTDTARVLVKNRGLRADPFGIYRFGRVSVRPYYGSAAALPCRYDPVQITDMGTAWREKREFPKADLFVLVCGGKWWELDETVKAARKIRGMGTGILLFNHLGNALHPSLPKDLEAMIRLYLPFFPNPFRKDPDADACFQAIWEAGTEGGMVCKRKGWFREILRGKLG